MRVHMFLCVESLVFFKYIYLCACAGFPALHLFLFVIQEKKTHTTNKSVQNQNRSKYTIRIELEEIFYIQVSFFSSFQLRKVVFSLLFRTSLVIRESNAIVLNCLLLKTHFPSILNRNQPNSSYFEAC